MKDFRIPSGFVLMVFCIAGSVSAQTQQETRGSSDVYTVGGRTLRIPSPEGFTDAFARLEKYTALITATESPSIEILASHVENSVAKRIERGGNPPLDLYTKVSVDKQLKTVDETPELFAATVAVLEKNFDNYIDPTQPLMKSVIKNTDQGLTAEYGREAKVDLSQPRRLGFFEKKADVLSALMITEVHVLRRTKTMLTSISLVNVNRRLLYVYGYKVFSSESDIQTLIDFTKKWTAAIVAANK
jgi:hypothetical protein